VLSKLCSVVKVCAGKAIAAAAQSTQAPAALFHQLYLVILSPRRFAGTESSIRNTRATNNVAGLVDSRPPRRAGMTVYRAARGCSQALPADRGHLFLRQPPGVAVAGEDVIERSERRC
jgi:hypothetical protein